MSEAAAAIRDSHLFSIPSKYMKNPRAVIKGSGAHCSDYYLI
jgi:hypothetical protein